MTTRLTIEEAAPRLQTSVRTIRRRIQAGTISYEKEPTPQGFRYYILLDQDASGPLDTESTSIPTTELLEQVTGERDWLRQHVEAQQQTIDRLTAQAEHYQVLLKQSQETLHLLGPRQSDMTSSSQQVDTVATPSPDHSKRHWWDFFMRGR